ncbi:WD40-repeat-containing domain protein [Schizophyllum fasciatum]
MSNPKTPSHRRGRSDAKTPLTPSLANGMNNISLNPSPTKKTRAQSHSKTRAATNPFDTTNPFLVPPSSRSRPPSRPPSPIKRIASGAGALNDTLQQQASGGVIRKGGFESKLDVITRDIVPPPQQAKEKPDKRSRSTPATNRSADTRDRYITTTVNDSADEVAATLEQMHLDAKSASPGHTARLAVATGVPINKRILGYAEPPPMASSNNILAQQIDVARPLYARPPTANSSGGLSTKARKISNQPERILDAPGLVDDFYLNLVDWSVLNTVAIALDNSTYLWNAETSQVVQLGEAPDDSHICSVSFSNDGMFLGVGCGTGDVELWDVQVGQKLRTMSGHQEQVASLSWNQHILTSGCGDGSIWHHDVRVPRHKVMELLGHNGEVCGLTWRADGELLASGGNDNVVNIWDGRVGDVRPGTRGNAKWTKRNHTAAVKALAWCPWQATLLASGGGTNDGTINVWNSTTGARVHSLKTPAQVANLIWSPHKKELLSTHGYPTNAIMVHAYPSMALVADIRDAHDGRVLYATGSPAGDMVCTASSGDEDLRFWRIWDVPKEGKKKAKEQDETGGGIRGRLGSTNADIMTLR